MIRNAVQHSENVRNSLVLNYKSAALPAELCRQGRPRSLAYKAFLNKLSISRTGARV
jgi:hypothetical protein